MLNIYFEGNFKYYPDSGNIFGMFFTEYNGFCFPDNQWTDFPVAVLRMWCENLISNVINSTNSEFKLFFMEGPFIVECSKQKDLIEMTFVNNRNKRKVEYQATISASHLISAIYQASHRLIWLLEKQSFGQLRDVEELKRLLENLK